MRAYARSGGQLQGHVVSRGADETKKGIAGITSVKVATFGASRAKRGFWVAGGTIGTAILDGWSGHATTTEAPIGSAGRSDPDGRGEVHSREAGGDGTTRSPMGGRTSEAFADLPPIGA